MYIFVMFFNTITISRYKLIDLINANKKNEKIKFKNSFLAILVFIVSISILSYAYWKVTKGATTMKTENGNHSNNRNILVFIWIYFNYYKKNKTSIFERYKYVCIKTDK